MRRFLLPTHLFRSSDRVLLLWCLVVGDIGDGDLIGRFQSKVNTRPMHPLVGPVHPVVER